MQLSQVLVILLKLLLIFFFSRNMLVLQNIILGVSAVLFISINHKMAPGHILRDLVGNSTLNILIIPVVSRYEHTYGNYLTVRVSIANGFFESEPLLWGKSLMTLIIKTIHFWGDHPSALAKNVRHESNPAQRQKWQESFLFFFLSFPLFSFFFFQFLFRWVLDRSQRGMLQWCRICLLRLWTRSFLCLSKEQTGLV